MKTQYVYMFLGSLSVNMKQNLGADEDFQECTNRSSEIGRSVQTYVRVAQHANRFYVAKMKYLLKQFSR